MATLSKAGGMKLLSSKTRVRLPIPKSLQVPPSKTDLKTPGTLSINIDSPEGKEPVALQWEISVPPAVAITTADIKVGKAAEAAGKSLTCAMKTKTQRASRYACILVGGQGPIKNGPIAEVHYHAQWDVIYSPSSSCCLHRSLPETLQ